jgi:hypothetical protein
MSETSSKGSALAKNLDLFAENGSELFFPGNVLQKFNLKGNFKRKGYFVISRNHPPPFTSPSPLEIVLVYKRILRDFRKKDNMSSNHRNEQICVIKKLVWT